MREGSGEGVWIEGVPFGNVSDFGVPGTDAEDPLDGIQLIFEGCVLSRVRDEDLLLSLGLSGGGKDFSSKSMWDLVSEFPWSGFIGDGSLE